jgi:hypothetical protein
LNKISKIKFDDAGILALRGGKNLLNNRRPYAFLVEKERTSVGVIADIATIFLSNSECPFRCLMCDLWKNTTDRSVDEGDIPKQIKWALDQLPQVDHDFIIAGISLILRQFQRMTTPRLLNYFPDMNP